MRALRQPLTVFVAVVALSLSNMQLVHAQTAPYCDGDTEPTVAPQFSRLADAIGVWTFSPRECGHVQADRALDMSGTIRASNGDFLQRTNWGTLVFHQDSATAQFTNGWDWWELDREDLVHWRNPVPDRPTDIPFVIGNASTDPLIIVNEGRTHGLTLNPSDFADLVRAARATAATYQPRFGAPKLWRRLEVHVSEGAGPQDFYGLNRAWVPQDPTAGVLAAGYTKIEERPDVIILNYVLARNVEDIFYGKVFDDVSGRIAGDDVYAEYRRERASGYLANYIAGLLAFNTGHTEWWKSVNDPAGAFGFTDVGPELQSVLDRDALNLW